jgi:hypothetical protein
LPKLKILSFKIDAKIQVMIGESPGGNHETLEQQALAINRQALLEAFDNPKTTHTRLFLINPLSGTLQTKNLDQLCDPANRAMLDRLYLEFEADITQPIITEKEVRHLAGRHRAILTKLPIGRDAYFLETETIFSEQTQSFSAQLIKPAASR